MVIKRLYNDWGVIQNVLVNFGVGLFDGWIHVHKSMDSGPLGIDK